AARRERVRAAAADDLRRAAESAHDRADSAPFPDERLGLLFACADPAVEPAARTPLMLQAVLGLDAARIASAFLVSPAAMAQRLVRAKAKLREAGAVFGIPAPEELPDRLGAVLEAVYAAYGSGWDDVAGADPRRRGLADEAVWLGRVVVQLLPGEPEALGLLALMLHCEARRPARRGPGGEYVSLGEQDVRLWSRPLADEAERLLTEAARMGRPGRFQYEAAVQSAHAARAVTGRTDWEMVALLYEGLAAVAPTVGALVGRAAALAEARDAAMGLAALDALPADATAAYQPYWALRAHLLGRLGRAAAADEARDRAAGLTEDPAVRAFLARGQSRG
ncbi:MAG: sigma-70 region 2 family protein, partial [Gemmataceae bacterium]|nr:sigma-70 region 2 family protein [Gemmataceae bacterium]